MASITSPLVFYVCACVRLCAHAAGGGWRQEARAMSHTRTPPPCRHKAKDTTPTDLISGCAFAALRAWRDRCKCSPDLGTHTSPACCSSFIYQPPLSLHSPALFRKCYFSLFLSVSLSLSHRHAALRTQASLIDHSILKCE